VTLDLKYLNFVVLLGDCSALQKHGGYIYKTFVVIFFKITTEFGKSNLCSAFGRL
jgi:hypothetical protein